MNGEYLEKFLLRVAPYRELWKSIRVTCLAVRHSEAWINLAARIVLREYSPSQPTALIPVPEFVAAVTDYPAAALEDVLSNVLVNGRVPVKTESATLEAFLSRVQAGLTTSAVYSVNWSPVTPYQRNSAFRDFGSGPCIALTGMGERTYEILGRDLLEKLDSRLRLQEPPYDGLKDLASKLLPGVRLSGTEQAPIQFLAPLPFDLEYSDPGHLIVRAPQAVAEGDLKVRAFFRPQGTGPLQVVRPEETSGEKEADMFGWQSFIEWPRESTGAKILLFFRDEEVDSIEVNRWPNSGDLRVAVDSFFDPEHRRLREFLLGEDSKDNLNFETAVVRLLNLLGIPVVWYGRAAGESRPDIGGLLPGEERPVIVVGECTRERPITKFSGLSERARELRDRYAKEAEVLPLVFTRAATTESEVSQAAEYGISLVGRSQIETLLTLLETPTEPKEVVHLMRTLRPAYFSGLIGGLSDRWRGRF